MDRPAEMSSTEAPSFWACFTEEFMNTVHREPRFTGCWARRPILEKSAMLYPRALAKVSTKEPQPEEQASFNRMESTAPLRILKHFISWPPMSMMKSTSGVKWRAAFRWATVSTNPKSQEKAFLIKSSP